MTNNRPIFQEIFGAQWDKLPVVLQKHYANRGFSNDVTTVEGHLDVRYNWLMKLLAPMLRALGLLVPFAQRNIATTVRFSSEMSSNVFCFDRECRVEGRKPFHFRSRLVPQGGNEVIEFMRFGIGWRCAFSFENDEVTLSHRGYVWRLFGINIPVPIGLVLGVGSAREQALSDTSFRMCMTITHPLWGQVYEYTGDFELVT